MTDPNFVGGGLSVRAQPLSRIELLERQVRSLQTQLDGLRSSLRFVHPHHARLCRTIAESTEYPATGDTFAIVFVDMDFTESEGSNPATFTDLSAEKQAFGKTADEVYVPEGTLCLAVQQPIRKILLLPLECG